MSAAAGERQSPGHRPKLDDEGELVSFVVSRMSGELTLGQIAEQLFLRFPDFFDDADDALRFSAALSQQYAS